MCRFSAEDEFATLLGSAELTDVAVHGHSFSHRGTTPDALWAGAMGSLARTAATILGQTAVMQ